MRNFKRKLSISRYRGEEHRPRDQEQYKQHDPYGGGELDPLAATGQMGDWRLHMLRSMELDAGLGLQDHRHAGGEADGEQ